MTSSPSSPPDRVRRSARLRGIIATVLVFISLIGVLVTLDLWEQTAAPGMVSLPSNLLLSAGFVVASVRAFAIAGRGGHTEGSAAADRLIALVGLVVVFAMVFSAVTAAGSDGWLALVAYAVALSAALETLLILNWKARSLQGPLAAQRPVGERRH
jgi:cobalamin synthase